MRRQEMRAVISARRSLLLAINPNIFSQYGTGWAFTLKPGVPWSDGYHIIMKLYSVPEAMSTRYWKWGSYVEDSGATTFFRRCWGGNIEHIFEWEPVHAG